MMIIVYGRLVFGLMRGCYCQLLQRIQYHRNIIKQER